MSTQPEPTPLFKAIEKYRNWLSTQVLPLWSTKGIDAHGASFERLLANGEPDINANKRIRVQARQMFSFAYGQHQGWLDNGMELVAGLDEFVEQFARNHDEFGYAHVLSSDNQIIANEIDLYDCAFFLLAYGWRYHVFNDLKALKKANLLLKRIDTDLKDNPGGWSEGGYIAPHRRQNPHMHMFEACLTLYKVTKDGKWLAKAGEMFCLFETRFYHQQQGVLLEYFDDLWQPVTKDQELIVEPGHMMEWVWLLRQYQQITGAPVDNYCHTLYHNALSLGLDRDTNTLVDEVSIDGRVLKDTRRCWPMTEWIKASLVQSSVAGNRDYNYDADAISAIEALLQHYARDAQYIDQIDSQQQVSEDTSPASTLYHLLMADAEANRFALGGKDVYA